MSNPYADWAVLAGTLAVLGLIGVHFTRRTFRTAVLAVAVAAVARVTWFGLPLLHRPADYVNAFDSGGDRLAKAMFGPLLPGSVSRLVTVGRVGWIGLLVVLGGVLAWLDTWSVRREQPRVSVPQVPDPQPGQPDLEARRELTEKLQFSLPAVDVRGPATMPGGSTMDSLASLAVKSGVEGGGVAAALIQAVASLQGQPRSYAVRMFTECCGAARRPAADSEKLRVTVEVRDARSGQSVAVRTLRLCSQDEAAEKVAGYTARQVFRQDSSTPAWAAGSIDGEDLSAYLLARATCPAAGTFGAWLACRQERRGKLERAAWNGASAGVVGYELAGMYDMDGENLRSLLLHLRNRVHYPRFWRGRYRLATSLSMLAGPIFGEQWAAASDAPGSRDGQPPAGVPSAHVKDDIIGEMSLAGLLRGWTDREIEVMRGERPAWAAKARLALLRLARSELRVCWRHRHASVLLWTAFWRRADRGSSLAALRGKPRWWRHPRRRLWPVLFELEIIRQRMHFLEYPEDADQALDRAQRRARRRLRFGAGKPAWAYQRAAWQAVYNAACLHALPACAEGGKPAPAAVSAAIGLLKLAITDPDCELDRPSEWIAMDPGLRSLRDLGEPGEPGEFENFVRDQAARDFDPDRRNEVGDPWFQKLLPEQPRTSGAAKAPRPVPSPKPPPFSVPAQSPSSGSGRGKKERASARRRSAAHRGARPAGPRRG